MPRRSSIADTAGWSAAHQQVGLGPVAGGMVGPTLVNTAAHDESTRPQPGQVNQITATGCSAKRLKAAPNEALASLQG